MAEAQLLSEELDAALPRPEELAAAQLQLEQGGSGQPPRWMMD